MDYTVVIRPYLDDSQNPFEIVCEQCYRCERQRVASAQELNGDCWTIQERIVDGDLLPSAVICGECYAHGYNAQCLYYSLSNQNYEAAYVADLRTPEYEPGNLTYLQKPERKRENFAQLES